MSTLADLQRRNIAQMENAQTEATPPPSPAEPSVLTEVRIPVSTDVLREAMPDGSKEASQAARKSVRAEASKPVRKEARQEVSADPIIGGVDAALASREPLIGGVKATVDMSPDLSARAKRYLADHRGQNTRQVLIALLDAFLTAKGY